MCDSSVNSSCLSSLEKRINSTKFAIDLLKISDNRYVGFREYELGELEKFIQGCIELKCGGSMFIFGLSGTGKTTTVEHALSKCSKGPKNVKTVIMRGSTYISLKAFKSDFFQRVLSLTPRAASKAMNVSSHGRIQNYAKFTDLLVQQFKKLNSLRYFTHSLMIIRICLIDEIDYLSTFFSNLKGYDKSNWLVQALFKAACTNDSKVVILAISNNLEFATKIKTDSCVRLLFKPYDENQMVNIVMEKLKSLNDESSKVLNKTSLLLLARRVANTSGDCRTYLDSFVRALSNSLNSLERDTLSIESLETNSGPYSTDSSNFSLDFSTSNMDSEVFIQDENNELQTPTRKLEDLGTVPFTYNLSDMNKYNVGSKEIGIVTPTLSMNKRDQLKQQLNDFPIFQLLLLLSICKSSIVIDEIISPNDAKVNSLLVMHLQKFFLELAEKLKLDSRDAENFCNSEFESSLENFAQMSLICKKEMVFKTDPKNLAKIILDSSCALEDLDFDVDISDPNLMLTKRYTNLTKSFSFLTNSKRSRKKLWWCR